MSTRNQRLSQKHNRRGAVAIELAVIAPLLLGMLVSMVEICRIYDMHNNLQSAARQGARLAGMDREGMLQEGETTNDKVTKDVVNFLGACGYSPDDVSVNICHPGEPAQPFDLDDPENYLGLFELRVEIPYGDTTSMNIPGTEDYNVAAKIVFRNARSYLVGN